MSPDPRAGAAADTAAFDALAARAPAFAESRLRRTAESLDPAAGGWPRFTRGDGAWERRGPTSWTSGFFPGALWYAYEHTRDPWWRAQAERWTAGLAPMARVTRTHDLGFVVMNTFGHAYRLTRDPADSAVVVEAARTLARRYSPAVGAIKSWDTDSVGAPDDRRRAWRYPVIVDNLMNLELLFWAAAHGGDPGWRAVAERHALTSLGAHVRDDGSVAHVALFDPRTGALLARTTWQGYADTSAWARGQAWAIHGLATAYRETGNRALLAGAGRAADYLLAHLPADGVPFWDFRHPDLPNTERDASAAAVAASGLLELARHADAARAARYRAGARRMLAALAGGYLSEGTNAPAVLVHSVGGRPQGDEIDVSTSWRAAVFRSGAASMAAPGGGDREVWPGAPASASGPAPPGGEQAA